ncbi:MAG: MaoC family dehydratase [Paracoccaceae bacterium]
MNYLNEKYLKYQKKIGKKLSPTNWMQITQKEINEFAELTQDPQFIHTDPIEAKLHSPFGKTIAHGFLVLSFASKFALDILPPIKKKEVRINYGFNKVRFIHPVLVDSKIRGILTLRNIEKKNEFSIINNYELNIEIQNVQKPAIVAEWIILNQFSK